MILAIYALTLPECPVSRGGEQKSLVDADGIAGVYTVQTEKDGCFLYIFYVVGGFFTDNQSVLPIRFSAVFRGVPEYADTFGVNHANALISLSQVSETLCILLIPFVLKHFGIKRVMLIAMLAWVLSFRIVRTGESRTGCLDVCTVHDCVWCGFRLLQHFRFVVC